MSVADRAGWSYTFLLELRPGDLAEARRRALGS